MKLRAFFSALILVILFMGAGPSDDKNPRFLVHLLDYLAKDYAGAVEKGTIISQSEYQEQVEFSESTIKIAHELPQIKNNTTILKGLSELNKIILAKQDAQKVAAVARALQAKVLAACNLELAPVQWPDISKGKKLFAQNCVLCHGQTGTGNGPAGAALDPKPANLLNAERMEAMSPFQVFNTIRLGVPGTGMVAHTALSDNEIWELSFYVLSLRHQDHHVSESEKAKLKADLKSTKFSGILKKVSMSSDNELPKKLPEHRVATLRMHSESNSAAHFLNFAKASLLDAARDYKNGDKEGARKKALAAYLEGVEPVEPRLRANDDVLTSQIETEMAAVRMLMEKGQPPALVEQSANGAIVTLEKAAQILTQAPPSPWLSFVAASGILLREGFEAVLVIIAFLSVIRASGAQSAAVFIHAGWIVAVLCGFVAWFFSGFLINMSGASRELMEAITSLVAVAVLLYIGFWMHQKTEIKKWTSYVNSKVKDALNGGSRFGLASIAFLAVFREAFETVLFLRAIWSESESGSKAALTAGVATAFVVVIGLAWAFLKYSKKIPVQKLFKISSLLMVGLSIVLTGKGLHALQESGLLPITSLPRTLKIELLGVFPSVETVMAQLAIAGLCLLLWGIEKRKSAAAVRQK